MATNTFRPTALRTGVATTVVTPSPDTGNSAQNQQTVYEWQDYSSQWKTNPPFTKGTAGTTMESLHAAGGDTPPRILRGYIRRSEYSLNDDASMSRLYFMYNPETISRDYMNYLDQGALDPFNTVFQSGNLVAPPSMLNFSFEIFFDRQEEARGVNNRGVMVDMDYFDLVVRNVKPTSSNNTLPDNGVMMVNPRDITVVFSPEITVQGRPLNASVTYERFTYKMVPTRMRINLQMRVVYFGAQREITTFVPETVRALESIPFPLTDPKPYQFAYKALTFDASNEGIGSSDNAPAGDDGEGAPTDADIDGEMGNQPLPSGEERPYILLNREAATHGWNRAQEHQPTFKDEDGNDRNVIQYYANRRQQLWQFCDCSSFIWACYAELGLSVSLTWEKWDAPHPERALGDSQISKGIPGYVVDTATMHSKFKSGSTPGRRLWGFPTQLNDGQHALIKEHCTAGDILLRHKAPNHEKGHVGIIWKIDGDAITVLHAGSESKDVYKSILTNDASINYNCAFRPYPRKS